MKNFGKLAVCVLSLISFITCGNSLNASCHGQELIRAASENPAGHLPLSKCDCGKKKKKKKKKKKHSLSEWTALSS